MNEVNVFSEIGRLKKVIVHRPGKELNNLTPDVMEELLFDEIPYLKAAQEEHDYFVDILRKNDVEVFYIEDLAAEVITDEDIKKEIVEEYVLENTIDIDKERLLLKNKLLDLKDEKEIILKMMEGTRREEIDSYKKESLYEMVSNRLKFTALPMPNLYFTRDPFSFVGNSVSLNKMWSDTRNRETLFGKYVFKYHDLFKGIEFLYDRDKTYSIEGGDILVLSKEVLAIGISQRTKPKAVEEFCNNLFLKQPNFKKVLAFLIPKKREFMHLDTVFTMVDKDLFAIHPYIEEPLIVYSIEKGEDGLKINQEDCILKDVLEENLEVDNIKLIPCGGNSKVDSEREQWNDGSNTLAIAPREIIVYDRNTVTNKILEENGVKLHIIKSGELSRGRGGPRCMSMPIIRKDI